ncbi:unnamed protein product [Lupinus luteus]|uniref:BED-type domain-containing protein n=1 Tax=Lupinus luteus TaxID=3873 RepID=A0AAV1WWH8_LUPLU
MVVTLEEDKEVVTPDLKKDDLVNADGHPSNDLEKSETLPDTNVENSESHPYKDLSSSEIQPNKDVPADTVTTSGGEAGKLPNHETGNSGEPSDNHPENSESLTSNQLDNAEASQNSQPINSDVPPINQSANSEAPHDDQLVSSKALYEHQYASEPNNHPVNSKVLPNNVEDNSEMQIGNEMIVSETEQNDEMVVSETQQNDEMILSETRQNDEMVVSETRQNDELVASESQQDDKVVLSETQQNGEVVLSENQQDNEVVLPVTQPNDDVVLPETKQNDEVVLSETRENDEVFVSETQQRNEVAVSETQQSNEVVVTDTQPDNEANMPETQAFDDVVMSEAIPENELANPTTDHNNQLSHSETFPDNQFTNFHMIPEDQLPQPESLPHSEPPPNSDPLTDNHLTDIKPIHHNHQPQYVTVTGNHLNHSEAFSNNHLNNSEALSHDQLANSQILTHYELGNNDTMNNSQLVNSQENYELAISNALPSYEIINAEAPLNTEERTPETQPSKRRKKKSVVWEHFTIETINPGCRRARCNQCSQTFAYSTGSKVAGTSHLKRHIARGTCSTLLHNQEHNQSNPYTPRSRGSGTVNASDRPKRRYRSPNTPYIIFDQDHCRNEIARMIIMHDYPLHMVEHPGFVAFVQNLQPQFKMVTFNTIHGDCIATYLMEKQNLLKYFEGLPGRVCLTLDIWTSNQSLGYVFITGHFVDNDWKLQRRILNVMMEPYPDSDSALSHAVAACVSDWSLEGRLFSVTCNQASNEVALENLRPFLFVKNSHILNGRLLVGNCIARTFSSVANDLLGSEQDLIKKIRDSVKYVKTSESHEEKFMELKQQLQVPSERSLFIDDQIQWNTTYQMLVAASELKEVFSCLDTSDPDYKGAPSMQDWKLVETLCAYLKPLFDAANVLTSTTHHPTAITFFHEVWKLQLDVGRAVTSEDPFISNINKIMHEKIDKYWRECSLILALAVVMDPRFKMKLVEFSFTKTYGDDAHEYIKIVEDGIHELFNEYVALPLPLTPTYAEDGSAGGQGRMETSPGGTLLSDNGLTDFDAYIMETTSQQMRSELDQYLEESLLPRVPDFDVLGWWKLNKIKYPTLSKMARDILSVPVSTVQPDSVFYTKNKEMDHYRSSLRPETVEALVCAKDWMQYGEAEGSNALVNIVF